MIELNEIFSLVLGIGCLLFVIMNRRQLKSLPFVHLIFLSFYCLVAGWGMTVLEGFIWPNILNIIEHISYAISAVFLAGWFWCVAFKHTGSV
jgi:hypothetical protein